MFIAALVIIILVAIIFLLDFSPKKVNWGVTFSQYYAQDELGVDWRQAYTAILDDLQADRLRLSAYWNHLEPEMNQYNFDDLDWQVNEAGKRGASVVLAIGRKLPRWPECHDPSWLKNLDNNDIQKQQLKFVKTLVLHYKDNPAVMGWQVENEPFLRTFGECPPLDEKFFASEIKLVRNLSNKPIMVTDSGELNWWVKAARTGADVVGTTLYRVVYDKKIGYFHYPLPPAFYYFKSIGIKYFWGVKKIIVAELQAESWHTDGQNLKDMTLEQDFKSFDLEQFKETIHFSEKAGFDESYLWGVEFWYFLKEKKGYDGFWQEAKKLWQE